MGLRNRSSNVPKHRQVHNSNSPLRFQISSTNVHDGQFLRTVRSLTTDRRFSPPREHSVPAFCTLFDECIAQVSPIRWRTFTSVGNGGSVRTHGSVLGSLRIAVAQTRLTPFDYHYDRRNLSTAHLRRSLGLSMMAVRLSAR